MRKRKGQPVHGWVALDKPLGLSSSQAVGKVRRALDAQKAGHGGTLDPLATGILPICLGEATKTAGFAVDKTKTYRFTVNWGEETSTLDAEGDVTETSDHRPRTADIVAALGQFTGEISQIPPIYSAIKVNGERSYKKARNDEEVELKARQVTIHNLVLEETTAEEATLLCTCGKGTYIRSLARDLARSVGTVGHVTMLRRTAVGPFTEENAISLDKLDALGHNAPGLSALLPPETVLDDIPALAITAEEGRRLAHGQSISLFAVAQRTPIPDLSPNQKVQVLCEGSLVAVAEIKDGHVKPVRVLNL